MKTPYRENANYMNTTLSKILLSLFAIPSVGCFGVHSSKTVAGLTQPQIGDIVQLRKNYPDTKYRKRSFFNPEQNG
jgi:hypothetical protein